MALELIPQGIRDRFQIEECHHACAILSNDYPGEFADLRDLMPRLGYSTWRNFAHSIEKAKTSCQQSGNDPSYHFADDNKMIATGKGATITAADVHLSRFACYFIAQNGDTSKPEIANAQKYFAVQTRRQELSDIAVADQERIELRDRCTGEFKALSGVAQQVGVNSRSFGIFHDAGYKGLYGGLGNTAIKERKGIPKKEQLMDRMGTTELAANAFRLTQAREKLIQNAVSSEQAAIMRHPGDCLAAA